jgi:primase-polymerase (primpol)-like protein
MTPSDAEMPDIPEFLDRTLRAAAKATPAPLPPAVAPLVDRPNWVIWRLEAIKTGKLTKVPYRATAPDTKAKTDDPSSWAPYADAVSANGASDGVGFVLTDTDIGAFDIDDCRDPDTGLIKPWAQQKIETVGSYAEITPSGTGVRIIGYGNGPPVHRKFKAPDGVTCELYRRATRYITVTGDQLGAWPLVNIDEHIDATQAELASARPSDGGHGARQVDALDDLILLNNPERLPR